jgi:UPF0176 protein
MDENRLSARMQPARTDQSSFSPAKLITVAAFYKFARIDDPRALREQLYSALAARRMKGTILVAPEGINGTISGKLAEMAAFLALLRANPRFADLVTKEAPAERHPFQRLKVKLKREIISLRAPEADPTQRVGTYVAPRDWNALISAPDVLVVDTRNAYEVAEGTFRGAIDPGTRTFGEWPAWVARNLDPTRHRRIAMFCTGGIRCEKASAYLLAHGFPEVHHLEGGILNYLANVPAEDSLWQGKCFVFDEREGVDAGDVQSPAAGAAGENDA